MKIRVSVSVPRFRTAYCLAVAIVVAATGAWQGVTGLLQAFGMTQGSHALFRVTGSFYNPGPYGGFLAMALPLWGWLWIMANRRRLTWAEYLCAAGLMLTAVMLPASQSRAGWLAALAGGAVVAAGYFRTRRQRTIRAAGRRRRRVLWAGVALAGAAAAATLAWGAYSLKPDSASGRMLMWKTGVRALAEHPRGVGWDAAPGAYGQTQENYFAAMERALAEGGADPFDAAMQVASCREAMVAGAPEYLFNEYLQVGLAWGVWALALMVALLAGSIAVSIARGQFGVAGALTAFALFSFASYPLQFPLFWGCALLLVSAAVVMAFPDNTLGIVCSAAVVALFAAGGVTAFSARQTRAEALHQWEPCRRFYSVGADRLFVEKASHAPDPVRRDARFLFEYGHALHRLGRYADSDQMLVEALKFSADPMPLVILGKNRAAMGDGAEAARYFKRAAHRIPSRIYPYYQTALLHAPDGALPDSVLFHRARRLVLDMPVKVMSLAVTEMRAELEAIEF